MSIVPNRKFLVKPIHLGPYSRAIILPAWWLKLNTNPENVEINITLDSLMVRPVNEEDRNEPEYPNEGSDEP
ncbi:hypothetical protein ACFLV5_01665 [Chloroflexota bacterium]